MLPGSSFVYRGERVALFGSCRYAQIVFVVLTVVFGTCDGFAEYSRSWQSLFMLLEEERVALGMQLKWLRLLVQEVMPRVKLDMWHRHRDLETGTL